MKRYIGTKIIHAEKMDHFSFLKSKGKVIPNHENMDGYKVKYSDDYESWSPKNVFEESYRPTCAMNFGLAIEALKKGKKVSRSGWNGKHMYIYLQDGTKNVKQARNNHLEELIEKNGSVDINAHIDMKAADGTIVIGWLASQTDILSDDWSIIE